MHNNLAHPECKGTCTTCKRLDPGRAEARSPDGGVVIPYPNGWEHWGGEASGKGIGSFLPTAPASQASSSKKPPAMPLDVRCGGSAQAGIHAKIGCLTVVPGCMLSLLFAVAGADKLGLMMLPCEVGLHWVGGSGWIGGIGQSIHGYLARMADGAPNRQAFGLHSMRSFSSLGSRKCTWTS